jgi:hypothetical protein
MDGRLGFVRGFVRGGDGVIERVGLIRPLDVFMEREIAAERLTLQPSSRDELTLVNLRVLIEALGVCRLGLVAAVAAG